MTIRDGLRRAASSRTHTHIYTYIHTHKNTYTYTHAHTHTHTHAQTHALTHARAHNQRGMGTRMSTNGKPLSLADVLLGIINHGGALD